jgi:tetratricopeptide (TPR) repeat protein
MKSRLPPLPPAPPPAPAPQPGASDPGRKARARVSLALLVLAVVGAAAWYVFGTSRPPEPPLPPDLTEAEVREVVEKARGRVLAEPTSGAEWGEYGTVLLANLFDREADFCLAEAATRAPTDPRWPYARAVIAQKRSPETALALFEKAVAVAEGAPKFRQPFGLALAEALLERGETDRAAAAFEQYGGPPDPERAHFGLALVAVTRGNDAEAARRFALAAPHPSCAKQAKAQLARLARARGDVPAAKQYEAESAAVEADPPWPDPYLDRTVMLQAGARGLDRRAGLLERDGQYEEAAALFLKQAQTKRTSRTLTGAGVNLARVNRYDEALAHLRDAVALDGADSSARYTLALVLYTKWEKLLAADPNAPGATEAFREVAEHARAAVAAKPDHARAMLFWGLALLNANDAKGALDPLRRALTVEPQLFDAHLALGKALAATGDAAGAKQSLRAAQQLRPNDPRPRAELTKLGG